MGYNTVMVLLNDGLGFGTEDPKLGERIASAANSWTSVGYRGKIVLGVNAYPFGGGSSSYGSIVSQDHADGYQVVIVHGNMGWRADNAEYDKYLGWQALDAMKECLERNGYRVSKPAKARRKKIAEDVR